ncbi:hypothetical protein L1049_028579 [Liquidambar formosana]|uniref:Elongation factor Ts, mitochondrial n=1 Tax=Liquidambar formosana TaxID=63359 RepID=A0AAP0RJ72_LIQFO
MAFFRGAKRSVGILYNRRSSPSPSYSTWTCRENSISQVRKIRSSFPFEHTNLQCAFARVLRRSFNVEVAASEQMNLIKQLRERTSAPIKDVKSALIDCNWDIEVAHMDLRKRGKVLASKKSSRTAAEGLLALAQNESKATVIELNCETDFVARNEIFQSLALSLAKLALLDESSCQQVSAVFPVGPEYLENLKISLDHPKVSGETTVQNAITEVAAMMGENIRLRRGFVIPTSSNGILSTYLHSSPQPGLGRIAGILSLEVEEGNYLLDALQRVGSELAMHVVAAKPLFLTKELVSSDAIEREREILKSQAQTTGKSQMAIEKMVEGRFRKYLEEVVLVEQKFVVDDTINVKTLLNNLSKEVGSSVKIGSFFRMEVGEGIQRKGTIVGNNSEFSRKGFTPQNGRFILDSKLYLVGGEKVWKDATTLVGMQRNLLDKSEGDGGLNSHVFVFDPSNPSNSLSINHEIPSMLAPKTKAKVATINGNVYVLGCTLFFFKDDLPSPEFE